MKIWKVILFSTLGIVVAGIALGAMAITWVNTPAFRTDLERRAAESLGRRVEIKSLRINWGNPVRIEIGEFHLGNAAWGTEPDMASFSSLSAVIEKKPLLTGPVKITRLRIDQPELFLERDQNGIGNWRFHDFSKPVSHNPFATRAEDRAGFPSMLDAALTNGLFRMKTSGGNIIRIDAHTFNLSAANDESPVSLVINGAYNGVEAKMSVTGGPYRILHDAAVPYPANVAISTGRSNFAFDGTSTDPLDADGMKGVVSIDAPELGDALGMVGLHIKATIPAYMKSSLVRAGDNWQFEKLEGHVAQANFKGDMKLVEGTRDTPDAISGTLTFDRLDGRRIVDGISLLKRPSRPSDIKRVPLEATEHPGVVVDAKIIAGQVYYDQMHIDNVVLAIRNTPGLIEVSSLAFDAAGGRASMGMKLDSTRKPASFNLRMELAGVEISQILHLTRDQDGKRMLSGPVNARLILDMQGTTIREALKNNSRGGVVAYMNDGKIMKKLLQLATVDLHILFGGSNDIEHMSCLLGVYTMRNGSGIIAPLRLMANDAGLTGGGTLDLLNRKIDVAMKPIEGTTGFLALDIPIRFSGSLSSIDIEPLVFGRADIPQAPAAELIPDDLIPELRDLALHSNCTKAGQ
jgi:uncharacterized protein involved in outer membrane biogenesis